MNIDLSEIKPFIYTNPDGVQMEVLFALEPNKVVAQRLVI